MEEHSTATGAVVPPLKSEPPFSLRTAVEVDRDTEVEVDRDTLCPICKQLMTDAFMTACGHSFCYTCIFTHLRNKSDCPCCGCHLTCKHIFPNLLLNKLLKKTSARQVANAASPIEHLRLALQQGCEVSVKELDGLLSLLVAKKRKLEQEEAETNMQILLNFLHCLRKQKLEELNEIQADLRCIEEDVYAVEKHKIELYRARGRCLAKLRTFDDFTASKKTDEKAQISSQGLLMKDACGGPDSPYASQSGLTAARKQRVRAQLNDLKEYYLQKRRQSTAQSHKEDEGDLYAVSREGYHPGLEDFRSVLATFTQYSRLRVIAELRHGDLFHAANIISSIEFDRDDELFASAGVSRRIKIFEFSSVVNEPRDVHYPMVEMPTRSKLSCLSWNKYTKNLIASSDYDGIVTIWDVTTSQSVMEYEEHEKRAWSVDFSCTEPSMLVSGSDDCKVGSADHHIHYYDLRNISQPLYVFNGHKKAVSYVKFLSNNELASASTDSSLRLWDVKENLPLHTFRGHTNEKNFVGLTVNNEYIACGSETNEVFVYHKAISKPAASHRFGSDADHVDDDMGSYFISAVCWKSDSPTMLTANRKGAIKVLVLAA
ncbi:E3 ubiquitin-protein ligase COP1 [Citrus sinensis]|nr:E3 ubiquitin-protein ligase COP1 [Citrus sinensis]